MSADDKLPDSIEQPDAKPEDFNTNLRKLAEFMIERKSVVVIVLGADKEGRIGCGYIGPAGAVVSLYTEGGDALAHMMRKAFKDRDLNG